MRSLILYYTYHGNTQLHAERLHPANVDSKPHIDTVTPYNSTPPPPPPHF